MHHVATHADSRRAPLLQHVGRPARHFGCGVLRQAKQSPLHDHPAGLLRWPPLSFPAPSSASWLLSQFAFLRSVISGGGRPFSRAWYIRLSSKVADESIHLLYRICEHHD